MVRCPHPSVPYLSRPSRDDGFTVRGHMAADPATTCSGSFGRPRMVRAGAATCWSLDDCRSTFYVAVRNVSLDGEFDRVVLDGGPERGGYTIGDSREECFVGEIDVRRQG